MHYFTCILISLQLITTANAQDDRREPCKGGLDFKGLVSFFKIKDTTKMIDTLEKACFEKFGEDFYPFTAYQRRYQQYLGGYGG